MFVHLSLFILHDAADAEKVLAALNKVPEEEPDVRTYHNRVNLPSPPPNPNAPDFAHVTQMLTFDTADNMLAYARSDAHTHLRSVIDPLVRHVTVAEYEL